jgi:hypothetical protein
MSYDEGKRRPPSQPEPKPCHFCSARATREIEGLPVCYAHIGTAFGVEPKPLPAVEPEVSPTFEQSMAEFAFRREAALYEASKRTIHLLRAAYWARQLGEPYPPLFLEYLDRVLERAHGIAATDEEIASGKPTMSEAPISDRAVAEMFEMGVTGRRPQYDSAERSPYRDELVAKVLAYRRAHPKTALRRVFPQVAQETGVPEHQVRHAYYPFHKNRA